MSAQNPPSRVPGSVGAAARGAVDLGALAAARESQRQAEERNRQRAASGTGGGGSVGVIVDVTEATFQVEVLERSMQVPVVVDLWSPRSEQSGQLSPVLERLAADDAGTWVLVKVNVDTEPNIAAAFQVQAVPTVIAVVKGQPVPLFDRALPEADVRRFIDELLKVATQAGLTPGAASNADAATPNESAEPATDVRFDAAFEAFEAGDWDAAAAAYQVVLDQTPGDLDASAGLVRVELMRRTEGVEAAAAVIAADSRPDDVAAQLLAADVEILAGDAGAAFGRLIDLVRGTGGDDRSAARKHLLTLFGLLGPADPDVAKARTALANALF